METTNCGGNVEQHEDQTWTPRFNTPQKHAGLNITNNNAGGMM